METNTLVPRTLEDWRRLPELPLGRHVVLDASSHPVPVSLARAAGVPGLRAPEANELNLAVMLPHVVVQERGEARAYRLPINFGTAVQALKRDSNRARVQGLQMLPKAFTFGLQGSGAYLRPDTFAGSAAHLRN